MNQKEVSLLRCLFSILLQLEHLPAMVAGIWTNDNNMQFETTTQFRKMLSIGKILVYAICFSFWFWMWIVFDKFCFVLSERSPPIEEVIQAGVVPRFVEFLMREDFPMLQVCNRVLICVINIHLCLYVPLTLFNVLVWGSLGFDKYCFWNIWKY